MNAFSEAAQSLFAVCAAAAAMDLLLGDQRGAFAFRSLCALAVATGTVKLIMRLMGM